MDQPSSRGRGATARDVTTSKLRRPCSSSARAADHLHLIAQPQLFDDLDEERGATQQGLDQRHLDVGPGQRQHQAGQAGAGADVAHTDTLRHPLREHGAVQHVPVPEPGNLAWPDEAALDTGVGEQRGVPLDQRQPVGREHPPGHLGHGGCFT